jgi:uncharacterized protein involved in outer membrane biogenesis
LSAAGAGALQGEGPDVLKSRALRWAGWTLLGLVLLFVVAWLAVPPLVKWQLQTRGSELLGRDVRVAEVQFDPSALALTLHRLSVAAAPDSAEPAPQLTLERMLVDVDARSLLRLAPVVDAIEIDAPHLRLARLADGRYDIDDLLHRFATPSPDESRTSPQRFALFNLRVRDGQVSLDDRPVGQRHELRKLTLGVPFLSNLPDDIAVTVEPHLAFELNGSAFESRGRSTPFAEGRATEFDLHFERLELKPGWAYLPAGLPARPLGGVLWADLKLRFEQHAKTGTRVEVQGQLDLRDLALQLPDGAPLLSWQSLRVRLADVQPLARRVLLDAVHLDGLVLHARRTADGALQLARLADRHVGDTASAAPPASAASASATAAPPAGAGWQLQLPLLELNAAQVHWHDAALQPAAELTLDGVNLRLKQLHWPVAGDATLQFDARLLSAGKAAGQLQAEGAFTDQHAKLALQAEQLDLASAAPYLRQWLRPLASGSVAASGELDWAAGATPRLTVALSSLRVAPFALGDAAPPAQGRKATASGATLAWQELALTQVRADVLQRQLAIGGLSLQRPTLMLARDAAGALDVEQWLLPPPEPGSATSSAASQPPWRVTLEQLQVADGRLQLRDAALPGGPLRLNAVRLSAQALSWPVDAGASPVDTQLAATLSAPGASTSAATLDWRGRVASQPLGARGRLRVERLPVHVFEPYFAAALPVTLRRAEAGFTGTVDLRQAGGGWQGRLRGDALLADVRIDARSAEATRSDASRELLSWNALSLQGLELELGGAGKPRLGIEQLRLSDYYAQLEITDEGRLYLQTLAPGADGDAPAAPAASASAAGAAAAPARVSRLAALPVELQWGGVVFSNGRVAFVDRFIRPNYSAELSDLYGRIGAFDTLATRPATLQFSGVVAGTGVLSIEGTVNPTLQPPALDIQAKATGIELPGLTPYAAKYAGYPIERGKLSVDVAYKIDPEGKLEASNKIVVNQLTFGEKTDSPEATTLPVRLAVALLQDRYGVIDVDLPVSGSLDDPQFSIGGLIIKAIVNLLTKVLTAPFALLAGGDGPDLSVIEFAPGSADIDAAGGEVIDKVASALADRPILKLSVLGVADADGEKLAMQEAALHQRVLDEQRRERARGSLASGASLDAPLPPLTPDARAALLKRIHTATALPGKPAGTPAKAELSAAAMQAELVAAAVVDDAAVRQLALQRGRVVRQALVAKGLGTERVFLTEPQAQAAAADRPAPKPMAQLTLSPL